MRALPIRLPAVAITRHQAKHIKHWIKWALIHVALVVFFADLLACIWPGFGVVWKGPLQKVGVACAAFMACVAEYLYDDEELVRHVKVDTDELTK